MKSKRLSDFHYDLYSSWFTADVLTSRPTKQVKL